MKIFRGFLLLFGLSAIGSAVLSQGFPVRIMHNPVGFATLGKPVSIRATLEGDITPDQVQEAIVWFRPADQDIFDFIELRYTGQAFWGEIPAEMTTSEKMEYYIEFTIEGNILLTYPEIDGASNPVPLSLRAPKEKEEPVGPQTPLVIISPEPFTEQESREVQVVVAFNRSVRELDPESIVFRVDGKDMTKQAMITDEILIASLSDVKPGRHRIDILYKTPRGGQERLDRWSFKILGPKGMMYADAKAVRGKVGFNLLYQELGGRVHRFAREDFNVGANLGKWEFKAMGRLSSEENKSLQPQHRYRIEAGTEKYKARVGDINPRYNKLALWGRRIRGAELDLRPGRVWVQGLYGDFRRAVDSRTASIDTIYVDDDPSQEIAQIDTNYTSGTFRRWAAAMRISYNHPKYYSIGYMTMKARDEISSIREGSKPKDNLIYGLDFNAFADRRRLSLNSNIAISLYADDISDPPLGNSKKYKDLIWINQSFDPLPNDTSQTLGNMFGSIFQKTLSHDTRLRARYFNNDLRLGYKKINRSFHTLSNPYMSRDRSGYFIYDRIRLFKSMLYLDLGFNSYHNNVLGTGDVTKTSNQFSAGFNIYTEEAYPDFSTSFRNRQNHNDAERYMELHGDINDQDTLWIDNRERDNMNFVNLSSTYNYPFMNTKNVISANMLLSDRKDDYSEIGEASQRMLNMNVQTDFLELPIKTMLGYSNSSQNTGHGMADIQYNTVTFRLNYELMNRKLNTYFGPRLSFGSGFARLTPMSPEEQYSDELYVLYEAQTEQGELSDSAYSVLIDALVYEQIAYLDKVTPKALLLDFSRVDWTGGLDYEFLPNHSIRAGISYSMQSDNNMFEYWNDEQFSTSEENIDNDGEPVTQSKSQDRNSILMTIGYQYRF